MFGGILLNNLTVKRAVCVVLLALTAIATNARGGIAAPDTVTILEPSGAVAVGESAEYASQIWNDPWDMSDPLDIRQLDSPKCVYPNHFDPVSISTDGIWTGKVRANVSDPDVFLLHPGYRGALQIGKFGSIKPINADTYTQLTIRMYIESVDAGDAGLQLLWTNGDIGNIGGDASRWGQTVFYKTFSGWHIYTIDLSAYKNASAPPPFQGSLPWKGNITGLRFDPGLTNMNGKTVQIDWVRLTPPQTQKVRWSSTTNGAVQFKLQGNGGNEDPVHQYQLQGTFSVETAIQASAGQTDLPLTLPGGDWRIRLTVGSDVSSLGGPWQVQTLPRATITRPSMQSGESFKSWEMDGASDIASAEFTTPPTFASGLLSSTSLDTNGQNTCAGYWEDPHVTLLSQSASSPSAIDTSKFRYASFRMRIDQADVSYGGVARFIWGDQGLSNAGVSNDIALNSGWNDFSIDMARPDLLDDQDPARSLWQASARRGYFRLDPGEWPEATRYDIDYVRLTAMDTVKRGTAFPIQYTTTNPKATVAVYYDTDTNTTNGRTRAVTTGGTTPPTSLKKVAFIPIVNKGNGTPVQGTVLAWDTSNVPVGTYYISIELSDGYNTTTWYSDAPMVVTN